MSKGYRWTKMGKVYELLSTHWQDGRAKPYPTFTGYFIESRYCHELAQWIPVLTYPDGGTEQFHSVTEAKAAAENDAMKEEVR